MTRASGLSFKRLKSELFRRPIEANCPRLDIDSGPPVIRLPASWLSGCAVVAIFAFPPSSLSLVPRRLICPRDPDCEKPPENMWLRTQMDLLWMRASLGPLRLRPPAHISQSYPFAPSIGAIRISLLVLPLSNPSSPSLYRVHRNYTTPGAGREASSAFPTICLVQDTMKLDRG